MLFVYVCVCILIEDTAIYSRSRLEREIWPDGWPWLWKNPRKTQSMYGRRRQWQTHAWDGNYAKHSTAGNKGLLVRTFWDTACSLWIVDKTSVWKPRWNIHWESKESLLQFRILGPINRKLSEFKLDTYNNGKYPIKLFIIPEPQNPSINDTYLVWKRRTRNC